MVNVSEKATPDNNPNASARQKPAVDVAPPVSESAQPVAAPVVKAQAQPVAAGNKNVPAKAAGKNAVAPKPEFVRTDAMPSPIGMMPFPRRRGSFWRYFFFILFVVAPTGIASLYYARMASPMYVSESHMAFIRSDNPLTMGGDFLSSLIKGATPSAQDVMIVQAYLKSVEVLRDVEANVDFVGHYSNPSVDFVSRLKPNPVLEDKLKYWQKITKVKFDMETGLLIMSVRAFDPEMALAIANLLSVKCEDLVNSVNTRIQEDSMQRSIDEVAEAERKVFQLDDQIERYRTENQMLNIESVSAMRMAIITDLEGEVAKRKAQLAARLNFLSGDSAEIRMLKAELDSLSGQLEAERQKVVDAEKNSASIVMVAAGYEKLMRSKLFAEKQYELALTNLETARVTAATKVSYVIPVVRPVLPDSSTYPDVPLSILAFFGANIIAYGFIAMVFSAIRDRM